MATLAQEVHDQMVSPDEKSSEDPPRLASQLPEPKGYKNLIALPEIEEKIAKKKWKLEENTV